jgi:lysophospholipase L1-like esterase
VNRIERWYTRTAIGLLNFLVLFVFLNVALAMVFHFMPRPVVDEAGTFNHMRGLDQHKFIVPTAFTGVSPTDLDEVLTDFNQWCQMGFPYVPWVGYGVHPFHSRLFNVSPLPQDDDTCERLVPGIAAGEGRKLTVYCLGGSTCLGWDLADAWTLPACLQEALQAAVPSDTRVEVHNLGQPGYYSSQEVALLLHLLRAGHRPDVVVFLDGFNDCWETVTTGDVPGFTGQLRSLAMGAQHPHFDLTPYQWLPMIDLALRLHRAPPPPDPSFLSPEAIVSTYEANVQVAGAACRACGVAPVFFWQPVNFSHNHVKAHQLPLTGIPFLATVRAAYEKVEGFPHVVCLGSELDKYPSDQPIFIDLSHYNPAFNRYLAQRMLPYILAARP